MAGNSDFRQLIEQLFGKAKQKDHLFWNTQPVLGGSDSYEHDKVENGPIDSENRIAPPALFPEGLEPSVIDINNESSLAEVYNLLAQNYVEDADKMFRLVYSKDFLRWYSRGIL